MDMIAIKLNDMLSSSVCCPPVIKVKNIAEGKKFHAGNIKCCFHILEIIKLIDKIRRAIKIAPHKWL